MRPRSFMVCVMLMISCLGTLLGVSWIHRLGSFAKSPQVVEIPMGGRAFVAGGRARLWFSSIERGAQVEVSNMKERHLLDLEVDAPSDTVCGIQVRLLELKEHQIGKFQMLRGRFEVTWDK